MSDTGEVQRFRLFLGCFISLIATAFGFAVRGAILADWSKEFGLSNQQLGYLGGVGLYPFAISIILLSLVVDRIGYGRTMGFAFVGHMVSALMTIFANSFEMLYWGTFIFALSNGAVEAVINPVVASMYDKNKTHWLNILHAGWPGGLVLGGLLAIAVSMIGGAPAADGAAAEAAVSATGEAVSTWRWQMALVLLPTMLYGALLFGQSFPVQERVKAGVSNLDMLREFGWGSAFICFTLLIAGVNQVLVVAGIDALPITWVAAIALVPTILFGLYVQSFGRPMFVFLLLVMFLLATTELGTDSWIADIMRAVLNSPTLGTLFLVYTSAIMFVLRFFAGPIVHKVSPLGLLALCSAVACGGLIWLSRAGDATVMLLAAATFYGFGKTFFWPTTLGVVSEQYPRGGALMLNAIAGVGMIAVGTIGNPGIGYFQDQAFSEELLAAKPELHAEITEVDEKGLFGTTVKLDQEAVAKLPEQEAELVEGIMVRAKQGTLAKVAILPAIMFVCYLILIGYFRTRGGYRAEVLIGHAADDEQFTGGVAAPIEA